MRNLTPRELSHAVGSLIGWEYQENGTDRIEGRSPVIERVIQCKTYVEGLALVQKIGELAEEYNHHPEMKLNYRTLTVCVYTHDTDGITEKDIQLARMINQLLI